MLDIKFFVKPFGLVPATEEDRDACLQLKTGSLVRAKITKDRSSPMLRLYWRVIGKVAKGLGYDKEALSGDLLVATKHVKMYQLSNGMRRIRPMGISEMDGFEFYQYVESAFLKIRQEYLPGISQEELIGDVERMLGVSFEKECERYVRGETNRAKPRSGGDGGDGNLRPR